MIIRTETRLVTLYKMRLIKGNKYIRLGQTYKDILLVCIIYFICGVLFYWMTEHFIWIVLIAFYVFFFIYSLAIYSHVNERLIINERGIIFLKKKKKILTRKVYYWETIRDVSYYADLYGKSKYESISITLFNGSYKKNITPPEEYDLSHFFFFSTNNQK